MLETLGLTWQSLLFHFINLAIIIVAAYFLLRKPVRKMVEKQNKAVTAVTEENARLNAEAEESQKNLAAITDQAKADAARIRKEAEQKANVKADAITDEAENLAKKIIATAKKEAAAEQERRTVDSEKRIAALSVEIAKKILEREVLQSDNQKIIDACIEELHS